MAQYSAKHLTKLDKEFMSRRSMTVHIMDALEFYHLIVFREEMCYVCKICESRSAMMTEELKAAYLKEYGHCDTDYIPVGHRYIKHVPYACPMYHTRIQNIENLFKGLLTITNYA